MLIATICIVFLAGYLISAWQRRDQTSLDDKLIQAIAQQEYEEFIASLEEKEQSGEKQYTSYKPKKVESIPVILASFNPNTADSITFRHLGLPAWMTKNTMPSVTEMLRAGKTPKDMMELAMAGFAPQVLDERTVGYQCDCSEERTKGMLLSLGRRELVKMRDEDPHCEVVCHFCHSRYQYDLNDLIAEYDAQAAQRAAEEAAQNTNA